MLFLIVNLKRGEFYLIRAGPWMLEGVEPQMTAPKKLLNEAVMDQRRALFTAFQAVEASISFLSGLLIAGMVLSILHVL